MPRTAFLLRSALLVSMGCSVLLLILLLPPPEPIANRLSEPDQIRFTEALQRQF